MHFTLKIYIAMTIEAMQRYATVLLLLYCDKTRKLRNIHNKSKRMNDKRTFYNNKQEH